jgi:hypothetical protein
MVLSFSSITFLSLPMASSFSCYSSALLSEPSLFKAWTLLYRDLIIFCSSTSLALVLFILTIIISISLRDHSYSGRFSCPYSSDV